MDMYPEYKSPLEYKTGDNKIDSYGVDHSKFSLRDEVEYQFARDKREQELINQYNSQGITSNYPQYGTNFWGNSDNNYGFGTSDISKNIENVTGKLNNNVFGQNENFEFPNVNSNIEKLNNNQNIENMNSSQFQNIFNSFALGQTDKMKDFVRNSREQLRDFDQANSIVFQGVGNNVPLAQNPKGIQVAPNTNVNRASDANISLDKCSDNALIKRMIPIIKNNEKPKRHIYIDTTWNKTTGAGANIDNWNIFNSIKWKIGDRFATEAEKRAAFDYFNKITVAGKSNVDANGKLIKKNNMAASYYKGKSLLEISDDEIEGLIRSHLHDDINYIKREFPDFKSYPPELQNVLVDIKFNTGNIDLSKWPNLRKAIAEKNLFGKNGIIYNVHRKDVDDDRNRWAKEEIEKIKHW